MAYKSLLTLVILLQPVLLLQTGCEHYKPFKVREGRMKEGPGLFSGDKGYFEVQTDMDLTEMRKSKKSADEDYNTRRHLDTDVSK